MCDVFFSLRFATEAPMGGKNINTKYLSIVFGESNAVKELFSVNYGWKYIYTLFQRGVIPSKKQYTFWGHEYIFFPFYVYFSIFFFFFFFLSSWRNNTKNKILSVVLAVIQLFRYCFTFSIYIYFFSSVVILMVLVMALVIQHCPANFQLFFFNFYAGVTMESKNIVLIFLNGYHHHFQG